MSCASNLKCIRSNLSEASIFGGSPSPVSGLNFNSYFSQIYVNKQFVHVEILEPYHLNLQSNLSFGSPQVLYDKLQLFLNSKENNVVTITCPGVEITIKCVSSPSFPILGLSAVCSECVELTKNWCRGIAGRAISFTCGGKEYSVHLGMY